MQLIILGTIQDSKTRMFLMKCGGYVRSSELRVKILVFYFWKVNHALG